MRDIGPWVWNLLSLEARSEKKGCLYWGSIGCWAAVSDIESSALESLKPKVWDWGALDPGDSELASVGSKEP